MEEKIKEILYKMNCDDPAHAIEDEDIDNYTKELLQFFEDEFERRIDNIMMELSEH